MESLLQLSSRLKIFIIDPFPDIAKCFQSAVSLGNCSTHLYQKIRVPAQECISPVYLSFSNAMNIWNALPLRRDGDYKTLGYDAGGSASMSDKEGQLVIYIISGGVGASGEQVVHTTLSQFPDGWAVHGRVYIDSRITSTQVAGRRRRSLLLHQPSTPPQARWNHRWRCR